ncbi:MAG: hypothetical protein QMC90_00160 [Dehalococcoidales bacterium]|nr:hypothetical protein [Dehalococcoidales bacterium]
MNYKQRGTAVAKVEQGLCRGCRISLSTAKLQQARSGSLVQCSSCGLSCSWPELLENI